jgi:hypothetical protein
MTEQPANPWGSCFDAAAYNLLANLDLDGLTMCHGIGIANKPGEEGLRIAHAWLEFDSPKGRAAIDPIWLVAQLASEYRKNLKAELVVTYSAKKSISLWTKHDYPGPWDDRIKAHTTEGRMGAAA